MPPENVHTCARAVVVEVGFAVGVPVSSEETVGSSLGHTECTDSA